MREAQHDDAADAVDLLHQQYTNAVLACVCADDERFGVTVTGVSEATAQGNPAVSYGMPNRTATA